MKLFKKAMLPAGFTAGAVSAGIKRSGKPDLALFYSQVPAWAVCLFTSNRVQAAPVKLCKRYLARGGMFRAILANSGNANCFTGAAGLRDAEVSARALAKRMGIAGGEVLVASTGIIGRRLAVSKITAALPKLCALLSRAAIRKASRAILTTDTFAKEATATFSLAGKTVTICGVAKGAGMIAPDMATMLCFVFTDAAITREALRSAARTATAGSFNCITVDGCMSTNDSVMLLANGCAGNPLIRRGRDLEAFVKALTAVMGELAQMIVRDAEGATKFIRIEVRHAASDDEARRGALAVANSNLFKTAVYGENPNFGRIVCALGASGIILQEERLKVRVSPLDRRDIDVVVSLGEGKGRAVVYTSDLTPEYIKINAGYN